jgi:hypothetical protein
MPSSLMAAFPNSISGTVFDAIWKGSCCPPSATSRSSGLANTAPVVGAQYRHAQALQWFLSKSSWSERAVEARRLELLLADPLTAPTAKGVLVIDEHGDRKDGDHTARGVAWGQSRSKVVWLYGLRLWVEQSYKQVKHVALPVGVPGQSRPRHPAALATGLLCLLVFWRAWSPAPPPLPLQRLLG